MLALFYRRNCIQCMQDLDEQLTKDDAMSIFKDLSLSFEVARLLGMRDISAVCFAVKETMDAILVIHNAHIAGKHGLVFAKASDHFSTKPVNLFAWQILIFRLAQAIHQKVPTGDLPRRFDLSFSRFGDLPAFPLNQGGGPLREFMSRDNSED